MLDPPPFQQPSFLDQDCQGYIFVLLYDSIIRHLSLLIKQPTPVLSDERDFQQPDSPLLPLPPLSPVQTDPGEYSHELTARLHRSADARAGWRGRPRPATRGLPDARTACVG